MVSSYRKMTLNCIVGNGLQEGDSMYRKGWGCLGSEWTGKKEHKERIVCVCVCSTCLGFNSGILEIFSKLAVVLSTFIQRS